MDLEKKLDHIAGWDISKCIKKSDQILNEKRDKIQGIESL